MAHEIDIRPPLLARLTTTTVLSVATVILAIASVRLFPGPLAWVLLAACVVGAFIVVRLFMVSVETRDDVLIVRNKFRTRHLRRDDIVQFRPAHPVGTSWLEFLCVDTADWSVPIDVLRAWTGGAERFAGEQSALEAWRAATP